MNTWYLWRLQPVRFCYTAQAEGQEGPLIVEFDKIGIVLGWHCRVYFRNVLIGECVTADGPTVDNARCYGTKFLSEPMRFPDENING